MDVIYFANWLMKSLQEKDWSQADLARASGLSRQAISNYISGKISSPDENALKAIAKALKKPIETIYRAAGLLPFESEIDTGGQHLLYLFNQLSDAGKEELLRFAEMKVSLESERLRTDSLLNRLAAVPIGDDLKSMEVARKWINEKKNEYKASPARSDKPAPDPSG